MQGALGKGRGISANFSAISLQGGPNPFSLPCLYEVYCRKSLLISNFNGYCKEIFCSLENFFVHLFKNTLQELSEA
jgi:hypothetical protein